MSLLNAIVTIPSLVIEEILAPSCKGFVFKFLLYIFLTMALANKEDMVKSTPPAALELLSRFV